MESAGVLQVPRFVEPLQEVVLSGLQGSRLQVCDGIGRLYVDLPAGSQARFRAGGACGWHTISVLDESGAVVQCGGFYLSARTDIQDGAGLFNRLLRICHLSFSRWEMTLLWRGRVYRLFLSWLRDNTHVLKAARYFDPQVKDGVDLFGASQREDGMIWDFVTAPQQPAHFWESTYAPSGFFRRDEEGRVCFVRMPVENDVEYLFVEGLYYAWQATGDDEWMRSHLDRAIRAMEYNLSDPLRYSQRFGLLKRAYTIDTWDFQSTFDAFDEGRGLLISAEQTRFGVMFGDNTGYALSCERLARMLEHVGRVEEANRFRQRAREIRQRLNAIAWRGTHFQHHVPEDPSYVRDFGVDEQQQISLSNAYSLNRHIAHDQAVAILRTYQTLRDNLPFGSPGEWYMIYPPFPRGWERHAPLWEYMNGGVSPIVAGELAHGAFEHGYEQYGVDILRRVLRLADETDGEIRFCYRGGGFEAPERAFQPVDLTTLFNMSFTVPGSADRLPWMLGEEPGNDLQAIPIGNSLFAQVPFEVGDGCVGIGQKALAHVELPLQTTFRSLYLLHTVAEVAPNGVCGTLTIVYTDGSEHTEYVHSPTNVSRWVFPERPIQHAQIGWVGHNAKWTYIGVTVTGWNNPYPDKPVASLCLEAAHGSCLWAVLGVTLSDAPVYFAPDRISFGGPDAWAGAAVAYALLEGLAGVKDNSTVFREATISPRWVAAGENEASVYVHYPASGGYVAYRFRHLPCERQIHLVLTGSGERLQLHLQLPEGTSATQVSLDGGVQVPFRNVCVEQTPYVDFDLLCKGVVSVRVEYSFAPSA